MKKQNAYLFIVCSILLMGCSQKITKQYRSEMKTFRADTITEHLEDDRSPIKKTDVKHLNYFPLDPSFCLECKYTLTPNVDTVKIDTYSGKVKDYRAYAVLNCPREKEIITLHIYQNIALAQMEEYKNYLFLPFMDATNGESSYGGGRYIDVSKKELKNGSIIIDFNKAYSPWCAYSDGFNCPVPPKENHLDIAILAGESTWTGVKKKGE